MSQDSAVDGALREKLDSLPEAPGVYLMKDRRGAVVYVGKAVNLRSRVRSYFGRDRGERPLLRYLVAQVADLDTLVTTTEKEALILENNLIKRHRPRYNVRLKDEKTYLSLRLERKHPFPRFTLVRRAREDGARYFGPYASAAAARHTLKLVYRAFGIRSCSDGVFANRSRPCLYYQIGQCLAPCVDYVDRPTYARALDEAEMFLGGRDHELVARLKQEMAVLAGEERFEEAARLRDRVRAIERTVERQGIETPGREDDFDVLGCHHLGNVHQLQWLKVRGGRVVDSHAVTLVDPTGAPLGAVLKAALLQHYSDGRPIPAEIALPLTVEDQDLVAEVLAERRGAKLALTTPARGVKHHLLAMAATNARIAFESAALRGEKNRDLLEEVRRTLALKHVPQRIDCFDMSHLGQSLAVGSMTVLVDGELTPRLYRHYRIRAAQEGDDYAMMREVLTRRLVRGSDEGDLPQLLVVDGGQGQVAIARSVVEELGLDELAVVGLAKGPGRRVGNESLWRGDATTPLVLGPRSPTLQLLARVRDEAHRFALRYQRQRRGKHDLVSRLDAVPGLGPRRVKALLTQFGSTASVVAASSEQIAAVPGIGAALAARLKATLSAKPTR